MPTRGRSADVVVVGAGIIGLATAWRASERGMQVTVLERDTAGRAASHVAAGMLAPVAELEFGETGRGALALGLRSAGLWPDFATTLRDATGMDVGLMQSGTLLVSRDADQTRELERQHALRDSLGLVSTRLRPSQARELEPALAPTVHAALQMPGDHSVDPRRVLTALREACRASGVGLCEHARVTRLEADGQGRRVTGVALEDGALVRADRVVLAAGAWTGEIEGPPRHTRVPLRPVRGQILRLRDPEGPGLVRHVVRFEGGYLVPRADGAYVLGATVEEQGFALRTQAGGIYELLRDAHEIVPGVSELEIEELCVGLRPGTPDNLPAIGRGALEGLLWASGHYRNGILLAPLTAEMVVALLSGADPDEPLLEICSAQRFAQPAWASQGATPSPPKVVSS